MSTSIARGAAAVLLVLGLLTGCARRGEQLGAGEDVGFCDAWGEFDGLDEPPLDDRDAVLRWAEGELRILDRVDERIKVTVNRRTVALPDEVKRRLAVVAERLEHFRDDVRSADDDEAVRRAVADLGRTDFDRVTDELTSFRANLCPGATG